MSPRIGSEALTQVVPLDKNGPSSFFKIAKSNSWDIFTKITLISVEGSYDCSCLEGAIHGLDA